MNCLVILNALRKDARVLLTAVKEFLVLNPGVRKVAQAHYEQKKDVLILLNVRRDVHFHTLFRKDFLVLVAVIKYAQILLDFRIDAHFLPNVKPYFQVLHSSLV